MATAPVLNLSVNNLETRGNTSSYSAAAPRMNLNVNLESPSNGAKSPRLNNSLVNLELGKSAARRNNRKTRAQRKRSRKQRKQRRSTRRSSRRN
jgi:hypothetical protein